ncbi:MAG TPA: hypothetical protein DCE44_22975 [Verrucomicrobiales bacterium]|nr:hypothetical protein [Verrucomicrobiales bacterium]
MDRKVLAAALILAPVSFELPALLLLLPALKLRFASFDLFFALFCLSSFGAFAALVVRLLFFLVALLRLRLRKGTFLDLAFPLVSVRVGCPKTFWLVELENVMRHRFEAAGPKELFQAL